MPYILKRTDRRGGYVADVGRSRGSAYTRKPEEIKLYPTREAAERDRCPENEVVMRSDAIFGRE